MRAETLLKLGQSLVLGACLVAISACGSNSESTEETEAAPAEDVASAGTDPVPAESLENPGQELAPEVLAEASPTPSPEVEEQLPGDQLATAEPQPEPVIAPPPPAPTETSSQTESYTVRSGDTLMMIAYENYGDIGAWRKILDANRDKLASPTALKPGMVLNLDGVGNRPSQPEGEKYKIRSGDTLAKISADVYGTPKKWKKIYENNRELIKNPNRIYAGFYLYYTLSPEDIQERDSFKSQPSTLGKSEVSEPPRDPASSETVSPAPAAEN